MRIINDILDVSRIEAERMQLVESNFDPRQLLAQARDLLLPLARNKALAIGLEIGSEVPQSVTGDEGRLRQILVNLAGNAIKFTERGEVRLALDASETIEGSARLRFRVSDTGMGITAEAMGKLFTPFAQLDAASTRRHGGTGLGLYIARELAQLMGGSLEAHSTPGQGSTFELQVTLPIGAGIAAPAELPVAIAGASLALLLVEDNDINQEVARSMLMGAGHRVEVAFNGAEAVRKCAQVQFDCVLMDCQMPVMDGLEATRRIREIEAESGTARVPIVAITANTMEGDRERCLAAGMDDFLSKPFSRASLLAVVQNSTARATANAAVPAAAPASFDPAALEDLANLDRDTPGLLVNLTRRFLDSAPLLIASVSGAATDAAQAARRAAHSLKSTSAQFGAIQLAQLAARAETAVLAGGIDTARQLGRSMSLEFTRVSIALEAYLEDRASRIEVPEDDAGTSPPIDDAFVSELSAQPALRVPSAPAVDVSVLKALVGDDAATVRALLLAFRASAAAIAAELRVAFQDGRATAVGASAHKLKSSAHAVGAVKLGALCSEMEQASKAGSFDPLAGLLDEFEKELAAVDACLELLVQEQQHTASGSTI
ncbi:MAG: sensor histidine kinase [Betaproteobacteria bacterium]|nr:sensor histidine kinase [Betaproteobacteria bacterium]